MSAPAGMKSWWMCKDGLYSEPTFLLASATETEDGDGGQEWSSPTVVGLQLDPDGTGFHVSEEDANFISHTMPEFEEAFKAEHIKND
jgi:hypothetical protein